jgi:hypothetical protein
MGTQRQTDRGDMSAAVYGKDDDIKLIPFPMDARSLPLLEYVAAKDLAFAGQMDYIGGECSARCEKNVDAVLIMMDAVPVFAELVRTRVRGTVWSELT